MNAIPVSQLKRAVEARYNGSAVFVESVPVREMFLRTKMWEEVVHIFSLECKLDASRVYAWYYQKPDGKLQLYTVLHRASIFDAHDAVRAIIAEEQDCV
jgi:hypothetical protein